MTRILICGGRDLSRHDAFNWLERNLLDIAAEALGYQVVQLTHIIQGGARGADEGAKDWAKSEGIPCLEFAADWKAHGRAAGPIRNRKMLDEGKPDFVLALPGGKGTANMIQQACACGLPVVEVKHL